MVIFHYLLQVTIGMRDDVESQNLLLNSVVRALIPFAFEGNLFTQDDRMTGVQTGLSGVVGNFKKVMETKNSKKNLTIIAIVTILILFLLWLTTR